jgi:hypothetical protein
MLGMLGMLGPGPVVRGSLAPALIFEKSLNNL